MITSGWCLMSLSTWKPLSFGISMSRNRRSGRSRSTSSTACWPSTATPTRSTSAKVSSKCPRCVLESASSSAITVRMTRSTPKLLRGKTGPPAPPRSRPCDETAYLPDEVARGDGETAGTTGVAGRSGRKRALAHRAIHRGGVGQGRPRHHGRRVRDVFPAPHADQHAAHPRRARHHPQRLARERLAAPLRREQGIDGGLQRERHVAALLGRAPPQLGQGEALFGDRYWAEVLGHLDPARNTVALSAPVRRRRQERARAYSRLKTAAAVLNTRLQFPAVASAALAGSWRAARYSSPAVSRGAAPTLPSGCCAPRNGGARQRGHPAVNRRVVGSNPT